MFCSNCGKQISENTKFCNYCGAQQQAVENTEPAQKATENQQINADIFTQQPKKAPKKKANIIIVLAVVLGVFLLGKFVIAPLLVTDFNNNDTGSQSSQSQEGTVSNDEPADSSNPEYDAIFEGTYIVHNKDWFGMDMKNLAFKNTDGSIICADLGYKDGVLKQVESTNYVPVSSCTDAQKTEIENELREQLESSIKGVEDYCTVAFDKGENYYSASITVTDADNPELADFLYEGLPAASDLESALLADGFVMK